MWMEPQPEMNDSNTNGGVITWQSLGCLVISLVKVVATEDVGTVGGFDGAIAVYQSESLSTLN